MEEVVQVKVEGHYWEKDGLYEEYVFSMSLDEINDDSSSNSDSSDSDIKWRIHVLGYYIEGQHTTCN